MHKRGSPSRKYKGLTRNQEDVLEYILWCYGEGYLPSYREVQDYFGWASVQAVMGHLEAMERHGYLELRGNRPLKLSRKSLDIMWG